MSVDNHIEEIRVRLVAATAETPGPYTAETFPARESGTDGEGWVRSAEGDVVLGLIGSDLFVAVAASALNDLAYLLAGGEWTQGELAATREQLVRLQAKVAERQASLAAASEDPTSHAIRAIRLDELGIIEAALAGNPSAASAEGSPRG